MEEIDEKIAVKSDFDLIIHKLPREQEKINIYPLGDCQVGSANFNKDLFFAWRKRVIEDPDAKVVLVGDILNMGLKTSKTNTYKEVMPPSQARRWVTEALKPLDDKILGAVAGNHEERGIESADEDPMFNIMDKLGLAELYRENIAFIKINLGNRAIDRQVSYNIVLSHGVSKKKTEDFAYTIDGMDVFVTGHIHMPYSRFPSKIVFDSHNNVIRKVGFTHVIVPAFDEWGGYTARGLYAPQDSSKIPIITLNGTRKEVDVLWKAERYT